MSLNADYPLADGICRVIITRTGSPPGHVTYRAQAWKLDAAGAFAVDGRGEPIRTPGSEHSINLSGLVAGTITREPGWVKYVPPAGTTFDPDDLPPGWTVVESRPDNGEPGDRVVNGDTGWVWNIGELERIRRGKRDELEQIIAAQTLDA